MRRQLDADQVQRTMTCPCGSGRPLDQCCGPIVDGAPAATAEALMRSRYTAHVLGRIDYILETRDPSKRSDAERAAVERWVRDSTWLGLTILARERGGAGDDDGIVEFEAAYCTSAGAAHRPPRALALPPPRRPLALRRRRRRQKRAGQAHRHPRPQRSLLVRQRQEVQALLRYLERATGLEPATACLGTAGAALRGVAAILISTT